MKFKEHKDISPLSEVKKTNKAFRIAKYSLYFLIATLIMSGCFQIYAFISDRQFRSPVVLQIPWTLREKTPNLISPTGSPSAGLIHQVYAEAKELTNEEYIRAKFGDHGDVAVAIAKAESGLREDAIGQNTNGTIDVGCWQVNSIHLKKENLTLETLLDCKKATDWVYDNLYLYQGFNPWVAFKTGSYLAKM